METAAHGHVGGQEQDAFHGLTLTGRAGTLLRVTWWILGALALGALVLVLRRLLGAPAYGKIYAPAHLAELASKLLVARSAALASVSDSSDALETPEAPEAAIARGAAFVTSQGIGVMYSILREGASFEHRLSMSHRGGVLAGAAAATLFAFVRRVLFPGGASCGVARMSAGTCMMVATLDAAAQRAFAGSKETEGELVPPAEPDCERMFKEAMASKERASLVAGLAPR